MIFLEVNIDTEFIRSWPGSSNWRVRPCLSSRLPPSRHIGGNVRHKMCHKIRILTLNTIGIWSVPGISMKVSKTPTTVIVTNRDGSDWNLKTLCSDVVGIFVHFVHGLGLTIMKYIPDLRASVEIVPRCRPGISTPAILQRNRGQSPLLRENHHNLRLCEKTCDRGYVMILRIV